MPLIMHTRPSRQAGLSLVELMVGITIGLIIVAAASLMMTNQVKENTQLLTEVQLQQDLRAAAELMLRDIRRAGYNGNASNGVWAPGMAAGSWTNIYAPTSPPSARSNFYYAYGKATAGTVPASNESFGFARETDPDTNRGVIVAYNGSAFDLDSTTVPASFKFATANPRSQPLTDPNTVNITNVDIQLISQPVAVGTLATPYQACNAGAANCPCVIVRLVKIRIDGTSVRYPTTVQRTINLESRIRNDEVVPSCT